MSDFKYNKPYEDFDAQLAETMSEHELTKTSMEHRESRSHPSDGALARIQAKSTPVDVVKAIIAKKPSGADPATQALLGEVMTQPKTAHDLDAFVAGLKEM